MPFNRILVIRGGAIGDFVLTLPALNALRDSCPEAHIEILGYRHIAALAENRFYAQRVRSIEYGPLSTFFAKGSEPPAELADYFAGFDLIISYLYDPDRIFEQNLRLCGVENLICGPARIDDSEHASRQLARPIEESGIKVADFAPKLFPSSADREFARDFLRTLSRPITAIHPGSGGDRKNWPLENWIKLGNEFLSGDAGSIVVVSGESDEQQARQLQSIWRNKRVLFATNLSLPNLAAVLEDTPFFGHDSGISHLAAAAGAKCVLLFGPTDPRIWAPLNKNVSIICAPDGNLSSVSLAEVFDQTGRP